MNHPMFDIFRGINEKDATWLEAASSLPEARLRMNELSAETPGQYFVFRKESSSVVARTDTRKSTSPRSEGQSESA
jgi:hypothetical protein